MEWNMVRYDDWGHLYKYEKGPSVNFCLKTFPRFDITESSK